MPETMEFRMQSLEARVKENEEKNAKQHREFYDKFEKTAIKTAVSDERHLQIMSKLETLQTDVNKIATAPANKWNNLVKSVLQAVGGAVGGALIYALAQSMGGG